MAGHKKEGSKRTLVRWSDDLDKQLLLSIQYACNEAGLRIPWENVAKLMGEKFSDGAIVQHMSKLRQKMVENDLPVPPPLKRGTTVVPSKIYATSSTARRKSMPDTPNSASNPVATPKPKQGASKKRNRRSGLDSDSDSQPDENDMDIADTSDEEYVTSGRKKKKQQRPGKHSQATKKANQESREFDDDDAKKPKEEALVKTQSVEEETIKESVETPGPASRTRGVRPDYSRLEQASDEEDTTNGDNAKENSEVLKDDDGEEDEEEVMDEDETEDGKIKSDGEVSPRSKVPASPATPAHLMNLPAFHGSPHSGNSFGTQTPYFGARLQYQSPQNTFPGVPRANYLPRSNMTSFSTNRNDSAGSLSSSMPPAFSSQSSFSQVALGAVPFSSQTEFFNQNGLDFNHVGGGFDHNMRPVGNMFRSDEDDHEEFGGLFDQPRQV